MAGKPPPRKQPQQSPRLLPAQMALASRFPGGWGPAGPAHANPHHVYGQQTPATENGVPVPLELGDPGIPGVGQAPAGTAAPVNGPVAGVYDRAAIIRHLIDSGHSPEQIDSAFGAGTAAQHAGFHVAQPATPATGGYIPTNIPRGTGAYHAVGASTPNLSFTPGMATPAHGGFTATPSSQLILNALRRR